ncbi:hypothetical protein [Pseudonocardia sp.]|jgi:hypothetical protein|uniref:hypothetical protein n=1 Tax=Pseudonocardia sp. TaxID=60912 RepID=UPI0026235339|nr:hypothetical protein [Pseudonocardia sp.]MCW2721873.1 hypothetical protein [Pseudonocardia sp.]MDT7613788.1 hypothetical protein [Pseudonocardiales bacterium]
MDGAGTAPSPSASPLSASGPSATRPSGSGLSRRRMLAGLLLVPPALAGCSFGGSARDTEPDPLIALADAARADVALITAAGAADPKIAESIAPLRAARTDHAAALDAEVARLDPTRTTAAHAPTPAPAPTTGTPTLRAVRDAVKASASAAATAVLTLPAERVGLVASVSACCATYAAALS